MSIKKKEIKCAIYTRKSCEEGLEQDFNSLDAQREACEAYIKSQQHEGWVLSSKHYDDGGFSGGNIERPALKELMADVESGEVDIIVVYKVDRLTRSLMDFSKIVELLDSHKASFVSITQHFNTTTSMGRLTLNVLLSFAQYEREVTGERIRDKVAASKKKGLWMGGNIPIGYKREDKKLIPDKNYVATVKLFFDKYLELKSVLKLKKYLDERNIRSRSGKSFSKGNLYKSLQNKIYIGMISHKGTDYEGEHEGTIDKNIFYEVQELIISNKQGHKQSIKAKSPSLLTGKLFDDKNNRMSPSHSNTKKKLYRYYVSQAITQGQEHKAGSINKIPAGEIESLVKNEVEEFIKKKATVQQYFENIDIQKQKWLISELQNLDLNNTFLRSILAKTTIYKEKVNITLCQNQLIKALEAIIENNILSIDAELEPENPINLTVNTRLATTSRNGNTLIINGKENQESNINTFLVKIIVKSYYWNKLIDEGVVKNLKEINNMEGDFNIDYIKKAVRLNIISTRIVEKILNGTQPQDLTVQKLCKIKTLDWLEQEKELNII